MTEQSSIETTLSKTLQVLVQQVGLSPAEVAQLRLSHLHLAGKNPNISFTPEGSDRPKTVELSLDAHRALVGWLVARPDSKGDFIFPGQGDEPLEPQEIQRLVDTLAQSNAAGAETPPPAPEPDEPPAGKLDETMVSPPRPAPPPSRPVPPSAPSRPMPPVSRPEPPPFRPEMGPRPPEMESTRVTPPRPPTAPPPTAPEVGESVNIPLPTSAPKPPPPPAPDLPRQEAQPVRPFGPQPEPEQAEPTPGGPQEVKADQPSPPGEKPDETKPPAVGPEPKDAAAVTEPPETKKEPKAGTAPPAGPAAAPKLTAEEAAAKTKRIEPRTALPRWLIWGSAGVLVALCVVCLGGGYLVSQSGPGSQLLASLGLAGGGSGTVEATEEVEVSEELPATTAFESPGESPLSTPTLPPTATATPAPTDTPPLPTDTPTPSPTDTPAAQPTATPVATDTPAPTDTPTPEGPIDTPTPAATPTPSMKYDAPVLIEPADDFAFIQGNTIVLRWRPVGELAPDEQYAVRMVCNFQGQPTYQGANVKESEWTVPLSLYGQVDGPENRYEWFVVVERLNDDGSGTAISPESQRRSFTWK